MKVSTVHLPREDLLNRFVRVSLLASSLGATNVGRLSENDEMFAIVLFPGLVQAGAKSMVAAPILVFWNRLDS